jgi:predicted Zn-dependent protease
MEIEADRIGMLLLAAAGFDPYLAVEVEEKLGNIGGDSELQNHFSTHPSSKKRAKYLLKDKVMEEALELCRESSVSKAEKASSWS